MWVSMEGPGVPHGWRGTTDIFGESQVVHRFPSVQGSAPLTPRPPPTLLKGALCVCLSVWTSGRWCYPVSYSLTLWLYPFALRCSSFGPVLGAPSVLCLCFDKPRTSHLWGEFPYRLVPRDVQGSSGIFPCPALQSASSPRSCGSFYGRMAHRSQDPRAGCVHCSRASLPSPARQTPLGMPRMCTNTHTSYTTFPLSLPVCTAETLHFYWWASSVVTCPPEFVTNASGSETPHSPWLKFCNSSTC